MDERQNSVTLVLGRKGSGKSHLAREICVEFPRRIICDPMRESTNGVIVRDFGDAVDYLRLVKDKPAFSMVLRTMDYEDELRLIALAVHGEPENPPLPDIVIYVDEFDRLCSPSSLPPALFRLANFGRHFRVSFIGVARSPKRIHRDFTRAADTIHVGHMNEPADVDYLNEFIGSDMCDRAKHLQDRQFLRWDSASPTPLPEDEHGPEPTEPEAGQAGPGDAPARDVSGVPEDEKPPGMEPGNAGEGS